MSIRKLTLLIAMTLAACVPAFALMLEYTVDQMVASSEAVVRGRVLGLQSRWLDGPGSIIVTDVHFQVDEVWTGPVAADRNLDFFVIGGTVDGLTMRQEHQPIFTESEETVLFLWTQPDEQRLAVFNDEQGRYRVVDDTVINFKRETIAMADFRDDVEQAIRIHKR